MIIHKDLEQGTEAWLQYRKWKITWTSLKSVMWWEKAQLTTMYELLAELYIEEEDLRPMEILERWHELEVVARLLFQDLTAKKVEEVGFIDKDDDHGLSPDGIIKDMYGKYTEALEIKCPRGKNYMKYYIEGVLPSDYKHQVINYFLVMSDLKLLHFMIFNPETIKDFPTYKIIEVTREELQDDLKKAEQKLDAFKQKFNQVKNEINRNKTIQK